MFDINSYLQNLISRCKEAFGGRLLYVGFMGSYLRGEATENSDIDVFVVIDNITLSDMDTYRDIIKGLGNYDKSCGFICGKDEMKSWSPLETCQLLYTTKDVYGKLEPLLTPFTREDEINYVKFCLGNLYHELCHRYIHSPREKNIEKFRGTCKFFFFLIQNLHYLETGDFILKKEDLKAAVSEADCRILEFASLPDDFDFDTVMAETFKWCQNAFKRLDLISQQS